jgi:hypothetical protein
MYKEPVAYIVYIGVLGHNSALTLPNPYAEVLTPVSQNVMMFEYRIFQDLIM